jgi:hypothetical protein
VPIYDWFVVIFLVGLVTDGDRFDGMVCIEEAALGRTCVRRIVGFLLCSIKLSLCVAGDIYVCNVDVQSWDQINTGDGGDDALDLGGVEC